MSYKIKAKQLDFNGVQQDTGLTKVLVLDSSGNVFYNDAFGASDLQSVTDLGNTTTNGIWINTNTNNVWDNTPGLKGLQIGKLSDDPSRPNVILGGGGDSAVLMFGRDTFDKQFILQNIEEGDLAYFSFLVRNQTITSTPDGHGGWITTITYGNPRNGFWITNNGNAWGDIGLEVDTISGNSYLQLPSRTGISKLSSDYISSGYKYHYLPNADGTLVLSVNGNTADENGNIVLDLPGVGTWGALDYPNWTSGSPFLKMTGDGIFSLDTSTYLSTIETSIDVTVDLGDRYFSMYLSPGGVYTAGRIDISDTFSAIGYQIAGEFNGLQIFTDGTAVFTNSGPIRTVSSGLELGYSTDQNLYLLDVNGDFHTVGVNVLDDLAGTGVRMVIANSAGQLSTQDFPGIPTLQQVTDSGNTTSNDMTIDHSTGAAFYVKSTDGAVSLVSNNAVGGSVQIQDTIGNIISIRADGIRNSLGHLLGFGSNDGYLVTSVNGNFADSTGNVTISAGITSITATLPITVTPDSTPSISTRMNTNKLIGRSSSGLGVMEEISIGPGLELAGGVLSNTATPTPLGYYGAWQDDITQAASADNIGVAMIFRTVDLSNGISIQTDGSNLTKIVFEHSGVYNLQFSSQFENADTHIQDVSIWLRKNGLTTSNDVAGSAGFISIPNSHGSGQGRIIATWNYLLSVTAGEFYQLMWSTTDHINVKMKFYAAGNPPPSAAAVILTVTEQAGIIGGGGSGTVSGTPNRLAKFTSSTVVGDTEYPISEDPGLRALLFGEEAYATRYGEIVIAPNRIQFANDARTCKLKLVGMTGPVSATYLYTNMAILGSQFIAMTELESNIGFSIKVLASAQHKALSDYRKYEGMISISGTGVITIQDFTEIIMSQTDNIISGFSISPGTGYITMIFSNAANYHVKVLADVTFHEVSLGYEFA